MDLLIKMDTKKAIAFAIVTVIVIVLLSWIIGNVLANEKLKNSDPVTGNTCNCDACTQTNCSGSGNSVSTTGALAFPDPIVIDTCRNNAGSGSGSAGTSGLMLAWGGVFGY